MLFTEIDDKFGIMKEGSHQGEHPVHITFVEGDHQLQILPSYVRSYAAEFGLSATLPCEIVTHQDRAKKSLFWCNGQRAYFRASKSGERLFAARYIYHGYEIIVVKEPLGKTLNRGKAALVVYAETYSTFPVIEVDGELYKLSKYHIWSPNIDFRKRTVHEAEVDLLVPFEDTEESPIEETDEEDPEYVPSTEKDLRRRGVHGTSYTEELLTFDHVEGCKITTLPPHLEAQTRDYHRVHGRFPPCIQRRDKRGTLFKYEGRDVEYRVIETGEKLDASRFRCGKRYLTVLQERSGHTIAYGQAVLLGMRVGGLCLPHIDPDGTEWTRTEYHIWETERTILGVANERKEPQVMKLIKRIQPKTVARNLQRQRYENNNGAAMREQTNGQNLHEHDQHVPLEQSPADDLGFVHTRECRIEPQSVNQEPHTTRDVEQQDGTTVADSSTADRERNGDTALLPKADQIALRGRKRARSQMSPQPLKHQELPSNRSNRVQDCSSPSRNAATTFRGGDGRISQSPILIESPEPKTRNTPLAKFAALKPPVMKPPTKHEFVFLRHLDGQEALRRPIEFCKTVQLLFAQAKKAKIADRDTTTLNLYRQDAKEEINVVGGDPDGFDELILSLDESEQKEEIVVLADPDK